MRTTKNLNKVFYIILMMPILLQPQWASAKLLKKTGKANAEAQKVNQPQEGRTTRDWRLQDIDLTKANGDHTAVIIKQFKTSKAYTEVVIPLLNRFALFDSDFAHDLNDSLFTKSWYWVDQSVFPDSQEVYLQRAFQNKNILLLDRRLQNGLNQSADECLNVNPDYCPSYQNLGDLIIHEMFVALALKDWTTYHPHPAPEEVKGFVGILLNQKNYENMSASQISNLFVQFNFNSNYSSDSFTPLRIFNSESNDTLENAISSAQKANYKIKEIDFLRYDDGDFSRFTLKIYASTIDGEDINNSDLNRLAQIFRCQKYALYQRGAIFKDTFGMLCDGSNLNYQQGNYEYEVKIRRFF